MVKKIYLHWTAGRYDQFFNDYHICIDGGGGVHKMADFETKLAHTWQRNSNAVGIAMCCCYRATIKREEPFVKDMTDQPWTPEKNRKWVAKRFLIDWGGYPPKECQIIAMAQCVAEICYANNLSVSKETVLTHAEVADMDGYGLHDNDPDLRWDLLRLSTTGNVPGGDVIRNIAKVLIREEVKEYGAE